MPGGKYRRYTPKYRPDLRWRQTFFEPGWLAALVKARAKSRLTGRREPVQGFGGWYVSPPQEGDIL